MAGLFATSFDAKVLYLLTVHPVLVKKKAKKKHTHIDLHISYLDDLQ